MVFSNAARVIIARLNGKGERDRIGLVFFIGGKWKSREADAQENI